MANITLPSGFNVGTDASITISDAYGDVFTATELGLLTDFESKAISTTLKVTPITNGGIPVLQTLWNGVSGRMRFVRQSAAFQEFFLEVILAYHQSGIITPFSMSLEILDRSGQIDEYLIQGVQFEDPDFGNYAGLKEVDMALTFAASLMQPSGGVTTFLTGLASAA